jgi:putative two-component system response regulator
MFSHSKKKPKILVVDDIQENIDMIYEVLSKEGYEVLQAKNGHEGLSNVCKNKPDLVITDIMMPNMNGFEFCKKLRENIDTRLLPVIAITSLDQSTDKIMGIEAGVNDFLTRPFDIFELVARVKNHVRLKKYIDELENAEKVIFSLANAVESRDSYTGSHCQRMADYATMFSKYLELSEDDIKNAERGGFLHDIGKIMIPDSILLKDSHLTSEEWEIMKKHPEEGARICQPLQSLKDVLPIIRWHQERWDGSGYPDGLRGTEIPLLARIISTIDCFDALTTKRPYRRALTANEAEIIMRQEAKNGKWDIVLVDKFFKMLSEKSKYKLVNSGGN